MCNTYVKCVLKPSTAAVKAWGYVYSRRLEVPVVKIVDGECSSGTEILMYEGNGDNDGTTEQKVTRCSNACQSQKQPLRKSMSWSDFEAKGFIVHSSGRCFCENAASATCTRTKNSYARYDWEPGGGVLMKSKHHRHQPFSDHLWIAKSDAEAMALKTGDKVTFTCSAKKLGPFTIKSISMKDGKNVLMKNGKEEKGTGVDLAFMNIDSSLHNKCKANTASDRLQKAGGASDKCVFPARLSGNKCVVSQNLQKLPAPKGMAWEAPLQPKSIPSTQKVRGTTCKITEAGGIAWCSKPRAGQLKCGEICCGCNTAFSQFAVKKKNDSRCKAPRQTAAVNARQTAAQKTKTSKWVSSCSQLPEGQTPWRARKTLGEGESELGGKIALSVTTKHKDCHYRTRMTVRICTSKGPSRTVNFPQADRSRVSRTFKCGCPNMHVMQMHTEVAWMRNTMKATQTKCSRGFITVSGWFFQRLKTRNKFMPRRNAVTKKQANVVYSWAHYNIRRMPPMMIQACRHSAGSVATEMAKMDKEANEETRKEIAATKAEEKRDRRLAAAASRSRQAARAEAADKLEEAERDRREAMAAKKAALMKEKENAKHEQKLALQAERDKAQVKLLQAEHKRSRLLQAQKEARAAAMRERRAYKKKLELRQKLDAREKQADLATERREKVEKRTDQEKLKREKERQKEQRTKERQQKAFRKAQERDRKSERKKKKKEAQKIYRLEVAKKAEAAEAIRANLRSEGQRKEKRKKAKAAADKEELRTKKRETRNKMRDEKKSKLKQDLMEQKEKEQTHKEKAEKEQAAKHKRHAAARHGREKSRKHERATKKRVDDTEALQKKRAMAKASKAVRTLTKEELDSKKLAKSEAREGQDKRSVLRRKETVAKREATESSRRQKIQETTHNKTLADAALARASKARKAAASRAKRRKAEIQGKKAKAKDARRQLQAREATQKDKEAKAKANAMVQREKRAELKSDKAKQKILEVKQSIMKGFEAEREKSKQKKRSERESELAAKAAYHKAEKKGEEIGFKRIARPMSRSELQQEGVEPQGNILVMQHGSNALSGGGQTVDMREANQMTALYP